MSWRLSGAYGEVRKCYNRETGALRAVKIINKKYLEEEEKAKLLNEVDVLRQMVNIFFFIIIGSPKYP